MPFLAQEHMDIPGQDLISWYFKNNPEIKDRDAPIYIDAGDPSRYYSHRTAELAIRKISNGLKENGLKQGDCVCLHSFNDVRSPSRPCTQVLSDLLISDSLSRSTTLSWSTVWWHAVLHSAAQTPATYHMS